MSMTRQAAHIAFAIFIALAATAGHCREQNQRPNILVVLADDMGINDLGHINRNETLTPNLDRLARDGISFSRHYTDSSCSPSRAALLTGMNPARVGFHPTGLTLPPDIVTLPEFLRRQGYHTALFGKWHTGETLAGDGPDKHGFDEWFGMLSHFYLSGTKQNGHLIGQRPTYIDPWLQSNGFDATQHKGHIDDLLTEEVVKAIARQAGKPWFIYVPLLSPHTPTVPNAKFAAKYPDTPNGRYKAVIEQMDSNVGAILQELERSGQKDNTIVVFLGDNGGTGSAFPSNTPNDGQKASYDEGGIRTPLIVYWPKHWTGGKRIDDVKYIADIYPTLVDALGLKPDAQLDGTDLFKRRSKPVFWYSQSFWGDTYSMLSANGEWRLLGDNASAKLLRYTDGRTPPVEQKDPAMQAKLLREYTRWRDSATLLPNPSRPEPRGDSKAVASVFRTAFSLGLSFSLPAGDGKSPIALIANKQTSLSYSAGEFILTLDAITLKFPYQLHELCNSIYMNITVNQDTDIFYGAGISQVELYVNDNRRIEQTFKIDRIDSRNYSPLTMQDFKTRPDGPVFDRSITLASRRLPAPEIKPALDALNNRYCRK
jgi:arylsulfatase A-like enzyme